jgi:TonB family protein
MHSIETWGQYRQQKKAWAMSVGLQSGVVVLLLAAASSPVAQQKVTRLVMLYDPMIEAYRPQAARPRGNEKGGMGGGMGGGDRSPLPPSKGRLPKVSPRPFTPPSAVVNNPDPRLSMEPAILAQPDVALPQVNMARYGDPLERIGPPSNGSGKNGGIGTGDGGEVGPGHGHGPYGPGDGDGVEGVWRVGTGGVSAPVLLFKVEPEYSEEARKAKFQGTVLLAIEVDRSGRAQNVRVARSLGLGLDEKAIEAVRRWKFKPGYKDGRPVTVAATIEVNFRLL